MLLQIGYLELAATFVVGAAALMMFIGRSRYYRPMLAIVGCMCLAAIVTPADLFSMLLMTIAFLAVYFVGTRRATANVARRSASQVLIGNEKGPARRASIEGSPERTLSNREKRA